MTMPAQTNLQDHDPESNWYAYDLELRTPPPMASNASSMSNGMGGGSNGGHSNHSMNGNGARKRRWEETASPVQGFNELNWEPELLEDISMNVTPDMGFITPDFQTNGDGTISMSASDEVEEIPRTKMISGCIPCL